MDAFRTGLLAGYGIAIPVGAIAVLIVQVGSKDGFGRAFFAGAGAATADLIYATVALVGGAALAGVIDSAGEPLRFISAGVLAGIAITGLVRSTRPVATSSDRLVATSHGSTYAQFLGLTMINPSTVVYFAAVVVGLGVAETIEPGSGLAFVSGAFLASLSWQTVLAAVGGLAGHRLAERTRRMAVIGGNLLILALAFLILVS